MMPHARLLAAASLLTAGLLALGPEAVVALADPDSGSSTGGASGSSTGGASGSSTTGSTGTSGGSTGTSTTGGSPSTGSSTTGSTTTGTPSTGSPTGGASSWIPPNLLGGMVGQFTRIIQHPTDVLNNLPVIGGGAVVVEELAREFGQRAGVTELVVSEHDILDGIALSICRRAWGFSSKLETPSENPTVGARNSS